MKLNITCPKCGSDKVSVAENAESKAPVYKCAKCGHTKRLFPKFESDKN